MNKGWIKLGGAIVLLLFTVGCAANRPAKIDKIFKSFQQHSAPGAAIMVIKDRQVDLQKTVGLASIESGEEITPATNFRLASVTKQFTAMAILMLIEENALDYETTLQTVFPEFPAYGANITIQQVLQHTSGLVSYESLIPDTATVQVKDRDVLAMMLTQDSTYHPPGSKYRYSNSGYAVLAMIVEKISGETFPEFLKKRIFGPLQMSGTIAYEAGISEVTNRAYGHTVSPDSMKVDDQSITSAVLGDGGVYSSLNDLFKWDQALYSDKLVSSETLQKAFTPHMENYGFGWRIDEYRGQRRLHHTGSTRGFRNVFMRFPEKQLSILILTNRNGESVAPLAEEIVDLYLD